MNRILRVMSNDELRAEFMVVRRELIKTRAIAQRKSVAQRAAWERRRAELRTFMDDDKTDHTESAGSPDYDLQELPDM